MTRTRQAAAAPAILVVDDQPFFRRLLADLLAGQGYRTIESASGAEVPELVVRHDVAAVLTDIEMPGVCGAEVLRRVKRLRPHVPVIIVSSRRDFATAREVLRDGALDYLTKPVAAEELAAAVARALEVYQEALRAAAAEREARRRLSDLVLLREIGETASTGEELQRLLERILDSIREAAEVEIASLMLLEEDGLLHLRAARGLSPGLAATVRVAPGEGIAGHVLATGEAVLIDDLARDGRFAASQGAGRYTTRSLLSVPVRSRDRIVGVLNVNNKRSGETFSAADQNLLTIIAHQTALAIENFRLVSSLRHKARELEEANCRLLRLHQERSRLVCNLSHELKTPLTSILGYADLLLSFHDQVAGEEQREYLAQVHAESLRMERLISGMLRLFSLDAGARPGARRSISLAGVIREVLREKQERIAELGLRTEVRLAEDLPELWGEPEQAAALVEALVDNAVKFNRSGGLLSILAEVRRGEEAAQVYLRIHNDGRTVPAEAGSDIFDLGTQLGDLNTDKPAGVGVGLTLCRTVVERMGGNIYLEPGGEGTTFGVLLPVGPDGGATGDDDG